MAAAELVSVNVLPPHARPAAVPLVPMPDPRVRPTTVRLDALMVGASGEGPKLFAPPASPLTSQPASVMPPPVPPALMVVTSLTVLSAESTSPPSETAVGDVDWAEKTVNDVTT